MDRRWRVTTSLLLAMVIVSGWSEPPLQPPRPVESAPVASPAETEWGTNTSDPFLVSALVVAKTYNPEWYALFGQPLAAQHTPIIWHDLPVGVGGMYATNAKTIYVNPSLQQETLGVMAAVLTHESVHALRVPNGGPFGQACVDEEVIAFSWEALLWEQLPLSLRGRSEKSQQESQVWSLWHHYALDSYVKQAYQSYCAL